MSFHAKTKTLGLIFARITLTIDIAPPYRPIGVQFGEVAFSVYLLYRSL